MTFAEIFQGATDRRGILDRIEESGKKIAWQEMIPFDPEQHLQGKKIQGLSPVNVSKRKCRFMCWDIDKEIDPKIFCKKIYTLDPSLDCFKSLSGRWHVYKFFDTWVDADEVKAKAKAIEKKIEAIGYECDKTHTLPQGYNFEKGSPGSWIFIPYSNKNTVCYSPRGNPLTKEQFEFKCKYKDHLLIAGAVGLAKDDGRHKALFSTGLYLKHHTDLEITLEDINNNFNLSVDERDLNHVQSSLDKEEYDKEYLSNGTKKFLFEMTGVNVNDEQLENEILETITTDLVDNYVYVRDRTDFFEKNSFKFADKVMLNDWYKHISKKKITDKLLEDPRLTKVHSYLTHAGLKPGVVRIKPRQIPGVEPGIYLNNYQGSDVVSRPGDVSKIIDYYKWLVGDEAWRVIEQTIAYWIVCPGVKIMWSIVLISKTEGAGKQLLALLISSILGDKNVKINVSFETLIDKHSTILEGKQLIVLNEVVMLGTGSERKMLANKLKPYISDPTLIVNPKNKPMIEIPNLCCIMILSNEENALHLTKDSRRYFIVNIKRTEKEILQKLEEEGIKNEILRAIKDPGPLKNYFENVVKIENKDIFFSSAPKTTDLKDMIDKSKGDLVRVLDDAQRDRSFPFVGKIYRQSNDNVHYGYSGLVIRDEFYPKMCSDPLFRSISYKPLTEFEDWLKNNCIPWNNGELTRQIKITYDSQNNGAPAETLRRRAYLIHNDILGDGRRLSDLTEGELGDHHNIYGYLNLNDQEIDTMKRRNRLERTEEAPEVKSTKLHETRFAENYFNANKGVIKPNSIDPVPDKLRRATVCWSCREEIDTTKDGICTLCKFGIPCNNCKECACDNPNSKLYARIHGNKKPTKEIY